jgi:hypothetical protein
MSGCRPYRELIENWLTGELEPGVPPALVEHARTCEDCRRFLEAHAALETIAVQIPEPASEDLRVVREEVGARIRRQAGVAPRSFLRELGALGRRHPLLASAALASLLVVAVLAGRWSAARSADGPDTWLRQIEDQAAQRGSLAGFWDDPVLLANVAVRSQPDGRLALSFDACRHLELVVPAGSPVAREALLSAILDSPRLGMRLKAMQLSPDLRDPGLAEALVYTLHHDPSLAVRSEARAVLARYPFDATVREALLVTLREDVAVQMRLLALEALAEHRISRETIERTIREAGLQSDPAVLQRAEQLVAGS